jgi:hypothetical protein
MKNCIFFLLALSIMIYADAPWSTNILVSAEIAWDTLDQGESSFDVFGDSIYAVCNTAQRGSVPTEPFAYSLDYGQSFVQIPFYDETNNSTWQTDPIIEVDDAGDIHMLIQFGSSVMNHYLSQDAGQTWSDKVRVSSGSGVDKPWWAFDGDNIYVVWQQVSGQTGIWLGRSTDNGQSFNDTRIWTKTGISHLAIDQQKRLHLVVGSFSGSVDYRKSTDQGDTWSSAKSVGNTSTYRSDYGDRAPITSITAHDDNVFVTWVDNSIDGSWEIRGARSSDGGSSFSQAITVNDDTDGGQCKGFAHFDCYGGLHVLYYHTPSWPTSSSSKFSVRHRYSPDGGATFKPSIRITDGEWESHADFIGEYHILRSDSQYVYAVWTDGRNPGDNDLYFSKARIDDIVSIGGKSVKYASRPYKILSVPILSGRNIVMKVSPFSEPLTINAFDLSGRKIKRIYNGKVTAPINLTVKSGDLPSGVVFFKVNGKSVSEVREIINLK